MRVRLVALLGCLAMLAILGAPTLAMSLGDHLPTAPWETSSPTRGLSVSDERGYLTAMLRLHRQTMAASRQLARSPRAEVRELATGMVAHQAVWVAQIERWLRDWYADPLAPGRSAPPPPATPPSATDRPVLRELLRDETAAVALCGQLLNDGLAVHPAVAGLAARIRIADRVELSQVRRLLA
jgi:hypothetical protein